MVSPQASLQVATVSDVMTAWVVTVAPSDSLLQARDVMTQNRVSQLVVVDKRNRPMGLISKRDIARFLLDDDTTRSLEEILVSEASSKSIPTIRVDVSVLNAARMFDTDNLAYAVVTNDNPLSGIITETDLCHYFSQKWPGKFRVTDFMRGDFIFAKSSYSVVHVAHAIVFRQPSVPVIDEELVGILTLSDILSIREKISEGKTSRLHSSAKAELALATTKDLMTRNPITTHEGADLAQAAQILINKGVGSLPVIDNESKVVGLITKHDIVKALGQIDRNLILET
ncbi:MAG: CBS domain-containing protein [Candidatus Bathyarchaeia archaeon]